jgi:uncharacterized SAM-binding protein YcdF (DUF218 family)
VPPIIIVLGAPNDPEGRLLPAAEGRALVAVREHRRHPDAQLLLTGGFGPQFNTTAQPHFTYVAAFLETQGIPPSAILGRLPSSHTFEDARLCADFLADRAPLDLKVVTSDFHAARARLLFDRAFASRPASIEMVVAPTAVPPAELSRLLRHESEAIARLG